MEFEDKKQSDLQFQQYVQSLKVKPLQNKKADQPSEAHFTEIKQSSYSKYTPSPPKRQVQKAKVSYKSRSFKADYVCDLHGHTVNESEQMLKKLFLRRPNQGWQSILIITGKGEGILRKFTARFLEEQATMHRFTFYSAPAHLGGSGAWVLLFS